MNILMVLTSHSELGNTGLKTGFWIEEFAAPYYVFQDAGALVMIASPKGGLPPIDPKSELPENHTKASLRYNADSKLKTQLNYTHKLATMRATDFDAVFYPGGHGPLWDLTGDTDSIKLIESFWSCRKPVAAVCHAPAALLNAKNILGQPILNECNVTGFSNSEEKAVELNEIVPFLLEDELKKKGGIYSKKEDWEPNVVVDGLLVTGQNPASSEMAALELIKILKSFTV
ncbi:MAG: type 1 glutamine amidotransferase domain-containing protein [Bacteroidota bacterium]